MTSNTKPSAAGANTPTGASNDSSVARQEHDALQDSTLDISSRGGFWVLLLFKWLFMAVVAFGWYRLLQPSFSSMFSNTIAIGLSVAATALLALLAPILARNIGALRAQGHGLSHWWIYFAILFAISSLGTLNSLFYFGESRTVYLETIDKLGERLEQVQARSLTVLVTPKFDELKANAQALLQTVANEMTNPRSCGEGPVAKQNIEQLQKLLPGFKPLSGNTRDCKVTEEIVKLYEAQVDKLLLASDAYQSERVAQSKELASSISKRVQEQKALLSKANANLDTTGLKQLVTGDAAPIQNSRAGASAAQQTGKPGVGGSKPTQSGSTNNPGAVDNSPSTRSSIEAAVENATVELRSLRTDLAAFAGDEALEGLEPLPPSSTVRGLGSMSQVLPLLLSRLDRGSTYLYVLVAIVADVILIGLYTTVFNNLQARLKRNEQLKGVHYERQLRPLNQKLADLNVQKREKLAQLMQVQAAAATLSAIIQDEETSRAQALQNLAAAEKKKEQEARTRAQERASPAAQVIGDDLTDTQAREMINELQEAHSGQALGAADDSGAADDPAKRLPVSSSVIFQTHFL